MKKIGKKLSFLTKIMLVIGLLVSNLSSLSVVFAYEVPEDVVITLDEDNLKIKYTELLAEEVNKVRVDVYESYTYLDEETDTLDVVSYQLDEAQLESARLGELELTHAKSSFKLFDGTYKMVVKFYSIVETLPEVVSDLESLETETPEVTEELITVGTYTEEVTYKSGLSLKVYNETDTEVVLTNEKYSLTKDNSKAKVDAYILAGGLAPSDSFVYDEVTYTAEELLDVVVFSEEYDFSSKLYGEYEYPISLELQKLVVSEETETPEEPEYVTMVYNTNVRVMYGNYADNTDVLNSANSNDAYYFDGTSKEGTLYNYVDLATGASTGTMLDLYEILEDVTENSEVEYKLFKGELDLIQEYNNTYVNQVAPVSEGEEETTPEVTLEDYLETIAVDGTVKVSLSSGNETISYGLVVFGDVNGDNLVNADDIDALVLEIISGSNDNENADLYGNDGVNGKDVLYLSLVLENKDWNVTVESLDAVLDVELTTDVLEEEELVSGDEFKVD